MVILFELNISNILILISLLMFSTLNTSSNQKITEKFNEESPNSEKRTNGPGVWSTPSCLSVVYFRRVITSFTFDE